jgi:protein SCO1/2
MINRIAFLALGAILALICGLGAAIWLRADDNNGDQFAQCRTGAVAGGASTIGGPFQLVNASGDQVTDTDVITEPSLIYFGYTFCPDICPMDVGRNADAVDLLAENGVSVTPVFITIDPDRDGPEVVGDYAFNLHEKMIGLTGSAEQIKAASRAYRTYYNKGNSDPEFYLMDHSTFTYLVLPEVGFVEFFRREESAEELAKRVQCFAEKL